jgi:hypothetical protein
VDHNVFLDGLNPNPAPNLVIGARDQDDQDFQILENEVFAEGDHPHLGLSYWAGPDEWCSEFNESLIVNQNCKWEVANCFGQQNWGDRYLWVYARKK